MYQKATEQQKKDLVHWKPESFKKLIHQHYEKRRKGQKANADGHPEEARAEKPKAKY